MKKVSTDLGGDGTPVDETFIDEEIKPLEDEMLPEYRPETITAAAYMPNGGFFVVTDRGRLFLGKATGAGAVEWKEIQGPELQR